jgi:phosphoglycolate phosphatase
VALELAQRMSVAPQRCALVGDSDFDMHAAQAAGMRAVAVSWGFRDGGELLAEGAEALIEQAEQLLSLV